MVVLVYIYSDLRGLVVLTPVDFAFGLPFDSVEVRVTSVSRVIQFYLGYDS
jgi:hypothetical protein